MNPNVDAGTHAKITTGKSDNKFGIPLKHAAAAYEAAVAASNAAGDLRTHVVVCSREVAKLLPGRVRQVITIGTPFGGAENGTRVGWLYRLVSGQPATMSAGLARRLARSPGVPTTSIYSRSDGIVAWQACLQPEGPQRENIEVQGSHCGMAWNADVLAIVADRLAQREGAWQKYRPAPLAGDGAAPARAQAR